ncbi:MAG: hypothetical protein AAFQ71_11595 [Planctomycetota bacterium]
MTLLETVVALALTASLATAILGWTTGLQRLAVRTSAETAWADAAGWTLARIEEDLRSGGFRPADEAEADATPVPRLEVSEDRLIIRPAAHDPELTVTYALDRDSDDLVRVGSDRTRPLLGEIESVRFEVIELERSGPDDEPTEAMLRVSIVARDGATAARALRVEIEEVRP